MAAVAVAVRMVEEDEMVVMILVMAVTVVATVVAEAVAEEAMAVGTLEACGCTRREARGGEKKRGGGLSCHVGGDACESLGRSTSRRIPQKCLPENQHKVR